jgi:transcriptional regulator with XRE-family HTH domain
MIKPAQCRAGRALVLWTMPQLAEASGVSVSTINSFELERRNPIAANLSALQRTLEGQVSTSSLRTAAAQACA